MKDILRRKIDSSFIKGELTGAGISLLVFWGVAILGIFHRLPSPEEFALFTTVIVGPKVEYSVLKKTIQLLRKK